MRSAEPVRMCSEVDAAELCRRFYFDPSRCERLHGYENENFLVDRADRRRFVLKVSPPPADRRRLDLELGILRHLEAIGWEGSPRWIDSLGGRPIESADVSGRRLEVRLLSWVDGRSLDSIEKPAARLLGELGDYLARLDGVLAAWEGSGGPGPGPPVAALWNLAEPASWPDVAAVEPPADRRRAERALREINRRLTAARPPFRGSLIHADPNHHNVLVAGHGGKAEIAGLIDFGDSGRSVLLFEVAIAATYVGIESDDPWEAALPLVAGYHARLALERRELELLLPAVRARLALSLAMSAARRRRGDADPYVTISERPARRALRRLASLSDEEALGRLVAALEKASVDD